MGVVYIVRTRVEPAYESEWLRWQDEEHVTNLIYLPGYRGVQRFADDQRPQHYLNIWRLDDRQAQSTERYRTASLTPWFERIRPHYEVSVEFSRESDDVQARGSAPWRSGVIGLVIDRWTGPAEHGKDSSGSEAPTTRDATLSPQESIAAALGAISGVAQVLHLTPLYEHGAPAPRSALSSVLLTYLAADGGPSLPPPAAGVERRSYKAMSEYLTAPGRSED